MTIPPDEVAQALYNTLISPNESDSNFESANVVDGLFAIARGLHHIARSIEALGNNNAATEMGAIEAASVKVSEAVLAAASTVAEAMES